jgi:hypothetical protein
MDPEEGENRRCKEAMEAWSTQLLDLRTRARTYAMVPLGAAVAWTAVFCKLALDVAPGIWLAGAPAAVAEAGLLVLLSALSVPLWQSLSVPRLFAELYGRSLRWPTVVLASLLPVCLGFLLLLADLVLRGGGPAASADALLSLAQYVALAWCATLAPWTLARAARRWAAFDVAQLRHKYTMAATVVHDATAHGHRLAEELAAALAAAGFAVRRVAADAVSLPDDVLSAGSHLLFAVLDPQRARESSSPLGLRPWLVEEARVRCTEARDYGPLFNIVYSSEGIRRLSFLRIKHAVFQLESGPDAALPPGPDYSLLLTQFGARPLLGPAADVGPLAAFGAWRDAAVAAACDLVVHPFATDERVRRRGAEDDCLGDVLDFVTWLGQCEDCGERFPLEQRRSRPSELRLRFRDLLMWYLSDRQGRFEIRRRYFPVAPVRRSTLLAALAAAALLFVFWLVLSATGLLSAGYLDVLFVAVFYAVALYHLVIIVRNLPQYAEASEPHAHEHSVAAADADAAAAPSFDVLPSASAVDVGTGYSPVSNAQALSAIRYSCPLDELRQPLLGTDGQGAVGDDVGTYPDVQADWIVNPAVRYDDGVMLNASALSIYMLEFVLRHMPTQPLLWVAHPITGVHFAFSLLDYGWQGTPEAERVDLVQLASGLVPGAAFAPSSVSAALFRDLVACEIVVPAAYVDNVQRHWGPRVAAARRALLDGGFCVLDGLLPAAPLHAIQRYYRQLFQAFGGHEAKPAELEKYQYNDEALSRYYNDAHGAFVSRLADERLLHPGLALSIFIPEGGRGFEIHVDSVPPFDLTLDIVVDHAGPQLRPVSFARRQAGGIDVQTLSLQYGQCVLFRGAELYHFGGDLARGNYHNVTLWTWSFSRD